MRQALLVLHTRTWLIFAILAAITAALAVTSVTLGRIADHEIDVANQYQWSTDAVQRSSQEIAHLCQRFYHTTTDCRAQAGRHVWAMVNSSQRLYGIEFMLRIGGTVSTLLAAAVLIFAILRPRRKVALSTHSS